MSCARDKISRFENSNIKKDYFKIISILSDNTITRLTFFFYSCEFGVNSSFCFRAEGYQ